MNKDSPNSQKNSVPFTLLMTFLLLGITSLYTNCEVVEVAFQETEKSSITRLNTSVIEIEYGKEWTRQSRVHLGLNSTSAAEMYLTNNPGCQSGGSWEPYQESKMWELASENAKNSVYVSFKDKNGHISECLHDDITHDNIPPTVVFITTVDQLIQSPQQATIEFVIIDNLAKKVQELICTLDNQVLPCLNFQFSFPHQTGGHSAHVTTTDLAGNTSETHSLTWTADFDPPSVQLTSTPSNPSGSSHLTFSFHGFDNHSGISAYKCSVDGATEQNCTSPFTISSLSDGSHQFRVVALDNSGNKSPPAEFTWVVDSTAPSLTISSGPKPYTNSTTAQFQFSGSDSLGSVTTFECRLDGGSYSSCSTGESYQQLAPGNHTFYLRARDNANNLSAPLSYSWKVDTTDPTLRLSQYPQPVTRDLTANFVWTLSDNSGIASLKCLHNGNSISCSGLSHQLTGLSEQSHQFQVEATDLAGNKGQSSLHTWRVDRTPPVINLSSGPQDPTKESEATFTFVGTDPGGGSISHYKCRIDSNSSENCQSPHVYSGLSQGLHTFYVLAVDEAGYSSPEVSYSWVVDQQPPVIEFTQVPRDHHTDEDATVSISVSDPPAGSQTPLRGLASFASGGGLASVQCGLDGTLTNCTSNQSKTYSNLSVGNHSFSVTATDRAGNTSTLSHSWDVVEIILCDPLTNPVEECAVDTGMLGNLYYFPTTEINYWLRQYSHIPNKVVPYTLRGYIEHGEKAPVLVHMSQLDIPKDNYESGFITGSGEVLTDKNGNILGEWFSMRLKSSLLPNTTSENKHYEFAMNSDDGMRVILDGKIILEDDFNHLARWTCSDTSYEFAPNEKKSLEVHHFQAVGGEMAMQLAYRIKGDGTGCPRRFSDHTKKGWTIVPPSFFKGNQ